MNVFVREAIANGVAGFSVRASRPTDARPDVPIQRLPSGKRTAAATPGAR